MSGSHPGIGAGQRPHVTDSSVPAASSVPLAPSSPDAMTGQPLQRKVVITNPMGFHLRPMAAFARCAATFLSTVTLAKENRRVNGKSPLELMLLAAEQGTELTLEASGPDAAEALAALAALLATTNWDDDAPECAPAPKG